MDDSSTPPLSKPVRSVLTLFVLSAIADLAILVALAGFFVQHGAGVFAGEWWTQLGALLMQPALIGLYVLAVVPWLAIAVASLCWPCAPVEQA